MLENESFCPKISYVEFSSMKTFGVKLSFSCMEISFSCMKIKFICMRFSCHDSLMHETFRTKEQSIGNVPVSFFLFRNSTIRLSTTL